MILHKRWSSNRYIQSKSGCKFQLNRVIMCDGGDPEEIAGISHRINSSESVGISCKKAHTEGRTGNEIAYLRISDWLPKVCL